MAPWKTPTQVAKNQNFHAVSSCSANSAMRKYAPMQTKINFSDSNLRASFQKRMEQGNATTCVKSSAKSMLLSPIPTSLPYAVDISIMVYTPSM